MVKRTLAGFGATCVLVLMQSAAARAQGDIVLYAADATTLAGHWTRVADATTRFAPIVRTTSSGMLVPAESASMMPDADGLLRDYKAGGTPLVLAARVSGDAKSAYPDGPPPPPAPD